MHLLGQFDRAEHGALEARGFFGEINHLGAIAGRQTGGAEDLGREGHGLAKFGDHPIDALFHRDGVGARQREGAARGRSKDIFLLLSLELDGVGGGITQVPRDALETGLDRTREPADDVARGIGDGENDRRILLAALLEQGVPRRHGDIAALGRDLLFLRLANLLLRLQLVLEVIGEHRAERRVGRREKRRAHETLLRPQAERGARDEHPGLLDREQRGLLGEQFVGRTTDGGQVVEDEKAAAKRGEDEVALAFLDREIADIDGGQAPLELDPALAGIGREEEAELGAAVEQPRLHRILQDGIDGAARGQVPGNGSPGLAPISALEHVRLEVALLVVVEGGVDGVGIVRRGFDIRDEGVLGDARKGLDLAPVLAGVLGDVDQAVVGAGIDEALELG